MGETLRRPQRGRILESVVGAVVEWLARDRTRATRQRAVELMTGTDAQLGEHLAEVVLDRVPADEQPRADLRVRETVAGELGDAGLLRGELLPRLDIPPAYVLTRGHQLTSSAIGERPDAHRREHLM